MSNDYQILVGNCVDLMRSMPENSVHAIVTDPPYELGFMGKTWDKSGVANDSETWRAALRVLKPGGHMLAFSGTRTCHRMVCAIEDAGFQIRDQLSWMYGTGFPKSMDLSKAIDKDAGAERAVTPDAQAWQGWGTALKPAHDPICLARKPLIGTSADNVLEYGTGGLNIDGCRIGDQCGQKRGRWPANVLLDQEAADVLDEQTENLKGNSGGPSRFFYIARSSRSEREAGLESLPVLGSIDLVGRAPGSPGALHPRAGSGGSGGRRNKHPTVKPIALMRHLCRLVTPTGGLVLDPFCGSGSTGCAALQEGFRFLGFDLDESYCDIARLRIDHHQPKEKE